MYKHYINTNENNEITEAFSDAYKAPNDDSIVYAESDIRQFNIEIMDMNGLYVNKLIDGDIVTTPEAERGTVEQRAEILRAKVLAMRTALYTETNKLLAGTVYDIMKAGDTVNPETLADWVAQVDQIKIDNPLP